MEVLFCALLFVLGSCLGSFLCCQARRLHLKEQGSNKKPLPARSICLHCKRQLKWYDNLPLISWLMLKGHCRYCHTKIGAAEFLSELFTGLTFLALGINFVFTHFAQTAAPSLGLSATPLDWLIFIITLLLVVLLIFLAIYDGLYGELPVPILVASIVGAVIILALKDWASLSISSFSPESYLLKPFLAVLILPGLYFLLYKISHGRWVGDGDWLLALPLALVLADPWLALLMLTIANLLACLCALPTVIRNHRKANPAQLPKIHLGPFLVSAFIFVLTFADFFQNML